jgi:hypothetical protein
MEPVNNFTSHKNTSSRVTSFFPKLLERQFPIESMNLRYKKTAQDFGKRLSVRVNNLNPSVKKITCKSTTTQISKRIIAEAKALLQPKDWTIAQIAHARALNFLPTLINYFIRMANTNPSLLRARIAPYITPTSNELSERVSLYHQILTVTSP